MPTKDPITIVGLLATLMLLTGAAMLYLTPPGTNQKPNITFTSPFKEPAAATPSTAPAAPEASTPAVNAPLPAIPDLTDAELKALTPAERANYDKLRQSLQQVLQQVQALEQENTRLQQAIAQGDAQNKQLDAKIDKLRAAENKTAPATSTTQ